ncbi:HAD family hydrolase [Sulfitobacter sp. SK012]|uniref:HAD family hydrolase n=1 Tax=Sulfitobacter sp. SK012 TaxID=1389005 RepID=UPI0020C8273C|nr:HAD family hydrolase [Sulfitobacter sp. SK012]
MDDIELVIFDCDGVLIDSEGISAEVLITALAQLGVTVNFDHFCTRFVGRSFPTVAEDIQTLFDVQLPKNFEQDYRRELLDRFKTGLEVTPGVLGVIDRLRVPRCIATSSSPERVARSLELTGLAPLFPGVVFTASQVARGKPAPDLFQLAARDMGVDPAHCLVIEDSLPGIEAGVAAGMRVLRYTGGAHLRDRVLKHDQELGSFDNWAELFLLLPELFDKAA